MWPTRRVTSKAGRALLPERRSLEAIVAARALCAAVAAASCMPLLGHAATSSWSRYESRHFVVISDRAAQTVRAKLAELERFRAAWFALDGKPLPEAREPIPTKVYLFAHPNELRDYLPDPAFAGAFIPTLRANYLLLADTRLGNYRNEVLFHELGHMLARRYGPARVPLWYAEGLAELYASLRIRGDYAILGKPPRGRLETLSQLIGRPIELESVLRRNEVGSAGAGERARFYALAWLLTHYLMLSDPDRRNRLDLYLDRYASGQSAVEAFRAVYGSIGAFNADLARYLTRLPTTRVRIALTDERDPIVLHALSEEQAAIELAELAAILDPTRALALLEDWGNPSPSAAFLVARARIEGRAGHYARSALLADRARRKDPERDEAAFVWATALVSDCTRQRMAPGCTDRVTMALATLKRYLVDHPLSVEAMYAKGDALALLGRSRGALEAYAKALEEMPWSTLLHYRLGITYANAGEPAAARRHLERVITWAERGDQDIADHARKTLQRLGVNAGYVRGRMRRVP